MIENSGETEPKEKKVPTVDIPNLNGSALDGSPFYTDSDGQIVADGDVYFYKDPWDGKTYSSIYMKDLQDGESWGIDVSRNGHGSFRILETDNYVGFESGDIYWED